MHSPTQSSHFNFPSFNSSYQVTPSNTIIPAPLSTNSFSTIANTPAHMSTSLSYPMPPMCISESPETKQLLSKSSEARKMVSFLANPRQRAESFIIEEVRLMLQEIESRKHVLLSLSPATHRLKRRAWEEVAAAMAAQWPHTPRRTAYQVKKKWENLVSKTKRKIRAGHITSDLDWSETNSVVLEFLIQHSPLVRQRYSMALNNDLNCTPTAASSMVSGNPSTTGPLPVNSDKTGYSFLPPTGALSLSSQSVDNLLPIPSIPSTSLFVDSTTRSRDTAANSVLSTGIHVSQILAPNAVLQTIGPNFDDLEDIKVNILQADIDRSQARDELRRVTAHNSFDAVDPNFRSPRELESQTNVDENDSRSSTQLKDDISMTNPLDQPMFPMQISNSTESNNSSPELQSCLMKHYEKEHQLRVEVLSLQKRAWQLQVELLQSRLNRK